MARQLTAAALWLPLVLHAGNALASATRTTTEYVVVSTTATFDSVWDQTETITTTRTLKPYVTPTADPVATSTYTKAFLDVEVVELYVPAEAVDEADLGLDLGLPPPGGNGVTSTVWVAPVTWTAPASCPTPFTVRTTAEIAVADAQTAALRPTSSHTYTGIWGPAVTLYLATAPPGPAPTDSYVYGLYLAECEKPPSASASGGLADDDEVCVRRSLCMTWGQWVIVLATVPPVLFVLGFAESFFWFRRLMRGRAALRLGTLCWILISGWVTCITRSAPKRAAADRPALEAQWAALSPGQKWRLWWRWGFRHKYPVDLLGPDPRHAAAAAAEAKVEEGSVPTPPPPYQPATAPQTSEQRGKASSPA